MEFTETTSVANDSDVAGAPARRRFPRRTYLWLLIGILSLVVGPALEKLNSGEPRKEERAIKAPSADEFRVMTSGEAQVRIAFAMAALDKVAASAETGGSKPNVSPARSTRSYFTEATKSYRSLLSKTSSPGVPRRILILEHHLGLPYDDSLVGKHLEPILRNLKTPEKEITTEVALWRGLYGKDAPSPPSDSVKRIRELPLRLLGNQALIDLYGLQKNNVAAEEQRKIRDQKAISFLFLAGIGMLLVLIALFVGVACLVIFLQAALRRRLDTIGQVTLERSRMDFVDLIDVFAFYFAVFEGSRILFSLILGLIFQTDRSGAASANSSTPFLLLELIAYLAPHTAALFYLWATLKRRGATWDEIGFTGQRLWQDIGYGILGYCAALPIMWGLGWLSQRIFRDNPDVTPNPAMSLLATQEDILGRIVLFLLISVGAPLFEELFFRGTLLGGLRKRYSMLVSVLISAALFSMGHPIQDWLPILALGLVFGVMRDLRQSLVPSMTAHFLQNSLTYVSLTILFGGN